MISMSHVERLASRMKQRRDEFSDRDMALIVDELLWDCPCGLGIAEFCAVVVLLAPFTRESSNTIKTRIWALLPDEDREMSSELFRAELEAAAI